MAGFKNIVVATDFSPVSDKALVKAVELARQLDAALHLVHIVQIHPVNMPESGNVKIDELEAIEEKSANDNLAKYVESYGGSIEMTTHVLHGAPAAQVNKMVEKLNADLIVMGTHGRTGLAHLIMGSVAESVLKKAAVPVMCVKNL